MELISLEICVTGRVKLRWSVRKDTSEPRVSAAPGRWPRAMSEPRIARSTYMKLPMLELIGMMMLPILLALYTLARSSSFKAANCSSALSSWQ